LAAAAADPGRESAFPEPRLAPDLAPRLPRTAPGGPDFGQADDLASRALGRLPVDDEPGEAELRRLARSLERLLGDEVRRHGIGL
jgi:hypothetical protein